VFLLKKYGGFSLFEMAVMPAEERAWQIQRLDKEAKKQQEAEKAAMSKMPKTRVPRVPKVRRK
jgi:hypothetical protein